MARNSFSQVGCSLRTKGVFTVDTHLLYLPNGVKWERKILTRTTWRAKWCGVWRRDAARFRKQLLMLKRKKTIAGNQIPIHAALDYMVRSVALYLRTTWEHMLPRPTQWVMRPRHLLLYILDVMMIGLTQICLIRLFLDGRWCEAWPQFPICWWARYSITRR